MQDKLLADKCGKDAIKNMIYEMQHRELDTMAKFHQQIGLQGVKHSVKGRDASNLLRQRGTLPAERNATSVKMIDFGSKERNRKFTAPEEMIML